MVMRDLEEVKKRLDVSGKGVYVQASTLGSLEALLEFLKSVNVRFSYSLVVLLSILLSAVVLSLTAACVRVDSREWCQHWPDQQA